MLLWHCLLLLSVFDPERPMFFTTVARRHSSCWCVLRFLCLHCNKPTGLQLKELQFNEQRGHSFNVQYVRIHNRPTGSSVWMFQHVLCYIHVFSTLIDWIVNWQFENTVQQYRYRIYAKSTKGFLFIMIFRMQFIKGYTLHVAYLCHSEPVLAIQIHWQLPKSCWKL